MVSQAQYPIVVGGDFNLIRGEADKNNTHIHWPRVRQFNDTIATLALRELRRVGARYTWTNKQRDPVRCVLDRVFVSPSCELVYPLCSLSSVTRICSDHTHLLLCSREEQPTRVSRFIFQTWWLGVAVFGELMRNKIRSLLALEAAWRKKNQWQEVSRGLRQFLKGWGANLGKEKKEAREAILRNIEALDKAADSSGLDEDGWSLCGTT